VKTAPRRLRNGRLPAVTEIISNSSVSVAAGLIPVSIVHPAIPVSVKIPVIAISVTDTYIAISITIPSSLLISKTVRDHRDHCTKQGRQDDGDAPKEERC
jgi:hypothetical protein